MTESSSINTSLTNIWHCWRAFRSGKKASRDITEFESRLEDNLLRLCADLHNGTYQHAPYSHHIINEKKRRDIAVSSVRDRVIHRLLYEHLMPLVDASLDPDVWSCRPNKGLHKALERVARLCSKYSGGYVWRADITKFFDHINHEILRINLQRIIPDDKTLNLLDKVISSYTIEKQASKQARPADWQFDESNFCQHLPQ